MPEKPVIRVERLSKKYTLGKSRPGDGGLRHVIEEMVKRPWKARNKAAGETESEFWALRDLSFEIQPGEVVGIIGRNGAGKSTLLKLLSRITEPSSGRISIKGRVASLLEVGTGFHPELTGRENIFLNGAILGMRRAEVRQKLDAIIAFAGIEKFLDTPVKRYSSGMYVRLAFAVAAHLEPEILIIDEVLAVGDAEFQRKCLGKMKEVSCAGRTVLFVSHNLPAVATLCNRGIYLESGRVKSSGDVASVLARYEEDCASATEAEPTKIGPRHGSGSHRITQLQRVGSGYSAREPLVFRATVRQHRDEGPFHLALHFRDKWDTEIFSLDTAHLETGLLKAGDQEITVTVESPWLLPGDYRVEAFLHHNGIIDHWPDAYSLRVNPDVAKFGYTLESAKSKALVLAGFRVEAQPSVSG